MAQKPKVFKLTYDRQAYTRIYFGDSVWRTFVADGNRDSLVLFATVTVLLAVFLVTWQITGTFYWIGGLLAMAWLIEAIFIFIELRQFYRWYRRVLRTAKSNERVFQNSELRIFDDWLVLAAMENEYRYQFDDLDYVEIDAHAISLAFGKHGSINLPLSAFTPGDYEDFKHILDSKSIEVDQDSEKIRVVEYDPQWTSQFNALNYVYVTLLQNDIITVEHVGSTSIPGLKSKPIIDIDIIIRDDDDIERIVIKKLADLGYRHVGDLGITGREAFKAVKPRVPDDGTDTRYAKHHLYVCREGSLGLRNHLAFRDYLQERPELIEEYGELKAELARSNPYDIDAYIDGKTDFIVRVLALAGLDEEDTSVISSENKV